MQLLTHSTILKQEFAPLADEGSLVCCYSSVLSFVISL